MSAKRNRRFVVFSNGLVQDVTETEKDARWVSARVNNGDDSKWIEVSKAQADSWLKLVKD
jgi:hypothetical protein